MYDPMPTTNVLLEDELQRSFIDYAMSVIIARAIPEARDGLKPVQRRILYSMYNNNNVHSQPTKKSAKIVGDVMGKYHPHGDAPIYEALVRMAQDFSFNHLLVEGQGNFGSVDGDPPAAMRYTEVRLTRLAEELLNDIEKETVEFVPNFDNTEKEPLVLASKIPNLLVNGASGIAVGVSTSIPPHNLGEVCDAITYVLDNKEAVVTDILKIIKGPDFPTGGIAIMSQNSQSGYINGRGQLTVRAKLEKDEKKNRIVVKEIPYNVNKSQLIQNIAELVRDKRILGIRDIRDESDKNGVSIVIELKQDANADQTINLLYRHTQMEITFPLINLAIVGKSLKSFNILQLISTFIDHRRDVVLKRSKYELAKAQDELHLVEGLLIAMQNIDSIVKSIKESENTSDARSKLISKFNLSEKQANAILDMKLGRLTHLEENSLNKQKDSLQKDVTYYTGVVNSPAKIDGIIKEETADMKKKYSRARRTEIVYTEEPLDIKDEDMISNEKVSVILTNTGYVKKMNMSTYKEQGRGGKGIISINLKEGDYVKQIVTCENKDHLICISNVGKAYCLKAYNIPEGSRYSEGKAIVNLLNLKDENIMVILNIKDFQNSKIAFLTAKGVIKKVDATLFSNPRANGVRAITLNDGDSIADVIVYSKEQYLLVITKNGKAIRFKESDLRLIGRTAMGVRGIRLSKDDVARNIIAANNAGSVLSVTEKGYGKLTDIAKYRIQNRGGGGVINIKVSEKNGRVAKSLFVEGSANVILINSSGVSITVPVASIRITGRSASGVRLMKLESGVKVVDARLISNLEAPIPTPV